MLYSPQGQIVFYQEVDGECPVINFLLGEPSRAQEQAQSRIQLLAERGHQLRRPYTDSLGDGLYELRWHTRRVQYRLLYSFLGRGVAVLLHACTKERVIRRSDLIRARERYHQFLANPTAHTKVFH